MARSEYTPLEDIELIKNRGEFDLACCDCGLVHKMRFRITSKGRIELRSRRMDRATSQIRRGRSPGLFSGVGKWVIVEAVCL